MTEQNPTCVSAALNGYNYQRDVTVWAALRMMLMDQLTETVFVEPLTEEDIETGTIELEGNTPKVGVQTDQFEISIQVKSRSTGNWGQSDTKALLKHGKKRPSAIEQLKDPAKRYLLITNAGVDGNLHSLKMHGFEAWPVKTPTAIKHSTGLDSHGRIGIIANLTQELLDARVSKILGDSLKVPASKLAACYKDLGEEVFALMGAGGGPLTRLRLLEIIQCHHGYAGAFAEADQYVKPDNYDAILAQLRETHGVVIVGPSGTGKTWMTKSLISDLMDAPGQTSTLQKVEAGPAQIGSYVDQGSVIFDVEDPWGKYKASHTAQEWSATLENHLLEANADKRIVVTSRRDFFDAAKPKNIQPWVVYLTARNYTHSMRARMYENRMNRLPQELQRLANNNRGQALTSLKTPMEIDKFFILLRREQTDVSSQRSFVSDCIEGALGNVIEDSIFRQVEASDLQKVAAHIWGLFKAYDVLQKNQQGAVLNEIAGLDPDLADQIQGFIDHLVAGFFIRLKQASLRYRHNLVEKGLRHSFASKQFMASDALSRLVGCLLSIDDQAALRLADAISLDADLSLSLPSNQINALDQVALDSVLSSEPKHTGEAFSRLSRLGSKGSTPARLARWLLHKTVSEPAFFANSWTPLEDGDDFYSEVGEHTEAGALMRKFVEYVLPQEHWASYRDFGRRALRLSPDLGETFRKVCIESFEHPGISSNSVLADAVLYELDQADAVLFEALKTLEAIQEQWEKETSHDWPLVNDEYPEEYAQHIYEGYGEEIYSAESFVKEYIEKRRKKHGWEVLKAVLETKHGIDAWISVVSRDEKAGAEEILFVWDCSVQLGSERYFWDSLHNQSDPAVVSKAFQQAIEAPDQETRHSAFRYGAKFSKDDMKPFFEELLDRHGISEIVTTLIALRDSNHSDPDETISDAILDALNENDANLARWMLGQELDANHRPSAAKVQQLVVAGNSAVRLAGLSALIRLGQNVEPQILDIIEGAQSPSNDTAAWLGEIVALAASASYELALKAAFTSPFASVQAVAIKHFGKETGSLADEAAQLAHSKSQTVLRALLDRIAIVGAEHCQRVLVDLSRSRVQTDTRHYNHPDYPFADLAANLLSECFVIEESLIDDIFRIAKTTEDQGVALKLFELCIKHKGNKYGPILLDEIRSEETEIELKKLMSQALFDCRETVELGPIDFQDASRLIGRQRMMISIHLAVLFGAKLPEAMVLKLTERLSNSDIRHGLLIPLAHGVQLQQGNEKAQLDALKNGLAEKVTAALDGGPKLPRAGLNELGHINVLDGLISFYGDSLFEAKPKAN